MNTINVAMLHLGDLLGSVLVSLSGSLIIYRKNGGFIAAGLFFRGLVHRNRPGKIRIRERHLAACVPFFAAIVVARDQAPKKKPRCPVPRLAWLILSRRLRAARTLRREGIAQHHPLTARIGAADQDLGVVAAERAHDRTQTA